MQVKNPFFCVIITETERIITLNKENTKNLQNFEINELFPCLKDISKVERANDGTFKKTTASKEVLSYLDGWVKLLVNKLVKCDLETLGVITEILRVLRNCAVDFDTQQYIIEKTNILSSVDSIFSITIERDINNDILKVLIQFLSNLISSNKDAVEKIYIEFYDRVKLCLKTNVHIYELSALIYHISLLKTITDPSLMATILEAYCINSENEFLIFFVENNISYNNFWTLLYVDIKLESKTMVLETLKTIQIQKRSHNLPLTGLEVLIDEFLKSAGSIFYLLVNKESEPKAYHICLLIEVLSSLSSDEVYHETFRKNRNLIINAGALLINIHKLGKENGNCFTPVLKLTNLGSNGELNEHPAFGFKADLIRLIGNLCWRNADMQDLTRTAELIPVILDCCNIDARNPFITQWSIFALRNLCENNPENQKIIAGLRQEGAVSSEALNEMGITLHSDGDSELKIISLENLKTE